MAEIVAPEALLNVTRFKAEVPVTDKALKIAWPMTVKVEVTVELPATKPPYNRTVEVAKAPRAVTEASVSVSAKRYAGQLRPFARQTAVPPTVRALNEPEFAFSCVVEAIPETNRLVVVTSTPVASPRVRFPRAEVPVTVSALKIAWPRTVKVEVTVEDDPTKPPYNCKVVVVNDPRALT